ncbi:MAG TPA: hypothetical protein VIX86_17180, partial [Streptosporangiaceae bacterium]
NTVIPGEEEALHEAFCAGWDAAAPHLVAYAAGAEDERKRTTEAVAAERERIATMLEAEAGRIEAAEADSVDLVSAVALHHGAALIRQETHDDQ